jgi:hypothetical protein
MVRTPFCGRPLSVVHTSKRYLRVRRSADQETQRDGRDEMIPAAVHADTRRLSSPRRGSNTPLIAEPCSAIRRGVSAQTAIEPTARCDEGPSDFFILMVTCNSEFPEL